MSGRTPHRSCPGLAHVYPNGLDEYSQIRLSDLVKLLRERNKRRYQCLADDLESYLKPLKRQKTSDEWPQRFVMDLMAAHIVDAMETGKYLQVARLVGNSPGEGRIMPYRAIFVREKHKMQRSGPGYIFPSWTCTAENARNSTSCKRLAKYASIEVNIGKTMEHGLKDLMTKNWTNGLCFFSGKKNLLLFSHGLNHSVIDSGAQQLGLLSLGIVWFI